MRYKNLLLPMAMFASLALAGCGDDSADAGTAGNAAEVATFEKYGRSPSLTLSAAPSTVASGKSTTLAWTSAGATTCAASGAWTGTLALAGSKGVAPQSTAGYTVTCRNSRGRTSRSVSVSVTAATPTPAPTPTATPAPVVVLEASATSVTSGTALTLTWSSTNATSCSASGGWTGTKSVSGIASLTPAATASYTLTCTGTGGSRAASTTVSVTAAPPPPPTPPTDTPPVVASSSTCSSAMTGLRTFDVGPGKTYTELTQVPWLSLRAGDVVNVFHRAEPYRTKVGIRAQGTAANPVVINGVTDASCNRPVISGENAVTPTDLAAARYFNATYSEFLGVVFINKASTDAWGYKPKHIQIRNLKISGAKTSNTYTSQAGATVAYGAGAAGIYAVTVEDLLVDNCEVTDNGNGVFVNTKNDSEEEASYRITVRNSALHLNGIVGSYLEHNLYVQAVGAIYEGNYIGQLRPGALGSSLKDRSSGTIVRFNVIKAASRALDLVESEGGRTTVMVAPDYNDVWVYGNVIIDDLSSSSNSSALLIHYGGDKGVAADNKNGTLYFYYNTVVTKSTKAQLWRLAIFDMPTSQQRVEAIGNVFAHYGDTLLQVGALAGNVNFAGTNWITGGWGPGKETGHAVTVNKSGTLLEGTDPLFVNAASGDYRPGAGSPLRDAGDGVARAALASRWIDWQTTGTSGIVSRPVINGSSDLGAFEAQ